MREVIAKHKDVRNAMYRNGIGSIDFLWGKEGEGKDFKKGYGVSPIIAKRNAENGKGIETAYKLIEVLAKETDIETQHALHDQGEYCLKVHYDGYTAILSSAAQAKNTWLLTGWEDGNTKKEGSPMSASGEVYDSSTATATMPTLTRHSGDIGDSSTSSIADSKNNSSTEKTSKATNKTVQQKKEQTSKQTQKEAAEEKTITQGLSPEGYNVYVKTRDTLLESPSDGVREAAPYSAVLFARMCERQAEEWTRQGKKTTAEDVAKSVKIRPDATQNDAVSGESFDQPMTRENKRYVLTEAGNLNFGEIPPLKADNGTIIKGAPIRL